MKVYTIQEKDSFKINLMSENQEETSILMSACNSVGSPIESFGAVNKDYTYAWFILPIRKGMKYRSIKIGNSK